MSATEIINNPIWWRGPKFLNSPEPIQPENINVTLPLDDPETKKLTVLTTAAEAKRQDIVLTRLQYFLDWHCAKKAIAVCLRFKKKLKAGKMKAKGPVQSTRYITVDTKRFTKLK